MNMRKYQIGQSNKYFNFSDIHVQINVIQSKSYDIINGVSISQQAGEGYFQNMGCEVSRSLWTLTRTQH
jgi:hypothetical protein